MEAAITFSPSGMYILIGFSVKTSAGRQIFDQVTPFCQVVFLRFSDTNDVCWVCKSRTGEATNWPGKVKKLTRCWEG